MSERIDIVILWVDDTDPEWISSLNQTRKDCSLGEVTANRFSDWGTLKYLLRGVDIYMPWVGKVHLVTCGQKPSWLDINNVNLVFHDDIFPDKTVLPVFNSSAIEMCIANINGLSEDFVYFNDDCLIFDHVSKKRYFVNGYPTDFFKLTFPRHGFLYENLLNRDAWPKIVKNSLDLINENYSIKTTKENNILTSVNYSNLTNVFNCLSSVISNNIYGIAHYHHAVPYNKSGLLNINKKYSDIISNTISSKFRSENNISQCIYRYERLIQGEFYPIDVDDFKFYSISSEKDAYLFVKDMNENNYRFACINDNIIDNEQAKNIVCEFLEFRLPKKSRFEL